MNITEWFNNQPAWMRVAIEIYVNRGKINDSEIIKLADICLSEAKGIDCSKYKVSDTNLMSIGCGASFSIERISDIKGVNAIDTNKPMCFLQRGINVVYGANGVGKSGYIRIFKMIAGATYREEIKPNIYKSCSVRPQCNVTITDDLNKSYNFSCDLSKAGEHSVLKNIDIFDTKTALGYVNEENSANFEPWIFGLFTTLGEVAEKISKELVKRKEGIIIERYNIDESIENDERIKALKNAKFNSKVEDFICDFNKADEERLEELKGKLQIEKNDLSIRLFKEYVGKRTEILDYFNKFKSYYTREHFKTIQDLATEWTTKIKAYKLSKEMLEKDIDDIDMKNHKSIAWKELWKYARILFDQNKSESDKDFTQVGGVCPLCHQKIENDVYNRMMTIDKYVSGATAVAEEEAGRKYKKVILHPQVIESKELFSKTINLGKDFESEIEETNNKLLKNHEETEKLLDGPIELCFVDIDTIIQRISQSIIELNKEISNLEKLNEVEDQKKIQEEIVLLNVKKTFTQNKETIQENLEKLKEHHFYDVAIKLTSTNKLTTKSKTLAKELITDAYINRFNEELSKLSASGLTVSIVQRNGRKGKNPYRVQLCDADGKYISPKDVLSEGESRAVALAAFFADASGRTESCPLIIDDPISSLDYEYENRVIRRLVELSEKRQIIVFTHRISMVVGISDNISNRELFNELSIKATPERKGIPSSPDINAGRAEKMLNKLLNENLQKLKKINELDDEYIREKHYICQQFRNCVEKSVEEYLIGEVVMRFRRDIQTKRIKYLPSIKQEDCDLIDRMMTKYSAYDHSMSSETPLVEFEITDIENDMKIFVDWIKERKKIVC